MILSNDYLLVDEKLLSFQYLRSVQKSYDFLPVEEKDVEMDNYNFDPQKSCVTLQMSPAKTETNKWNLILDDEACMDDQGCFTKVCLRGFDISIQGHSNLYKH